MVFEGVENVGGGSYPNPPPPPPDPDRKDKKDTEGGAIPDESGMSLAMRLLGEEVTPMSSMDEVIQALSQSSLRRQELTNELSVQLTKIRDQVRQEKNDAAKDERDANLDAAKKRLGMSAAIGAVSGAGPMLRGAGGVAGWFGKQKLAGVLGKVASSVEPLAQSGLTKAASDMGEAIIDRNLQPQLYEVKIKQNNADYQSKMADDFQKKQDKLDSESRELLKKATDLMQSATSLSAQAMQSVSFRL